MQTLNQEKNDLKRRVFYLLLFLLLAGVFASCVAHAEEDKSVSYLRQLKEYEIDSRDSLLDSGLRSVGFAIVKFLGGVADDLYSGIDTIFKLLTFGSSDQIEALLKQYAVLYKIFFIVSVTFFGVYLLCGKSGGQLNTLNCIFLIALVITAMPLFTEKMTTLTVESSGHVKEKWLGTADDAKVQSIASTVLAANVVDLKKVDKNSSKSSPPKGLKKNKSYNYLKPGEEDWKYLDINAKMDYHGESGLKLKLWNQKISQEKYGIYTKEGMNGVIFNEFYYRYQILSWFEVFVLLGTVVILLLFICIKCAKIVIEVAMANVYMPFVAVTDLAAGQRIREALKNFLALFAVLFLCIALLGVYFAGYSYINAEVSGFPKLVMHIALVWAILEGPNIIERISGVDAGVKSVGQGLMGMRAAAGMAAGAAGAAGGAVKKGAAMGKGAYKAANVAAGAAIGRATRDAGKEKIKSMAGDALLKATGGKGLMGVGMNLAGAGKNLAKSLNEKMHSAGSVGGGAEPGGAEPYGSQSSRENPFEKDGSSRSSADNQAGAAGSGGSHRADQSSDNMDRMNQRGPQRQGRPGASAASQANRQNLRGQRSPSMAGKARQADKPLRSVKRPQPKATKSSRGGK